MGNIAYGKNVNLNVCVLGLDSAGKASLVYALKLGEHIKPLPNIGLTQETVQYKHFSLNLCDVGGGFPIQNSWSVYTLHSHAIIFVLDSTDANRISNCKQVHDKCLSETDSSIPVVYYANKQDLPNSMTLPELIDHYELNNLTRNWVILPCSACNLQGIWQGIAWICNYYTYK